MSQIRYSALKIIGVPSMSQDLHKNYINGHWLGSSEVIDNISPSDISDSIGHYAKASNQDCLDAISAANAAFDGWSQSALEQRKTVLDFIGAELIARSEEIGEILAREEGRPALKGSAKYIARDSSSNTMAPKHCA